VKNRDAVSSPKRLGKKRGNEIGKGQIYKNQAWGKKNKKTKKKKKKENKKEQRKKKKEEKSKSRKK